VIVTLDTNKTITLPLGAKPLAIPNPGLCIFMKVNSDLVFDKLDEALSVNHVMGSLVAKVEESGLKMRTVPVPNPFIDLRPSLARAGDYLILASSDTLVREMLAVKSGQKKGFKDSVEFKRLSQGIPAAGNNFSLTSGSLAGALGQIQEKTMSAQNLDPEALKRVQEVFQRGAHCASYSVCVNGPEGWEAFANGSQGLQSAIVPAFVAGLVAAIAVPNFVHARATAQKNACINNLRLIDSAKQQWALDQHKQSTDTPTKNDLLPYLGGKFPVCPDGGVYTIGPVGQKPTCSTDGHELP
jgi:hypothetical protein